MVDRIKNEKILITIGQWLENNPISPTFSSHDRIMGFSALETLRYVSLTRTEAQHALKQLEKMFDTASSGTNPPHQTLVILRGLFSQNEDQH